MTILGTIRTPIGLLTLKSSGNELTEIDILTSSSRRSTGIDKQPLAEEAGAQLAEYFKNPGFRFHLPLNIQGTDFQKRVWKVMSKIPPGKVMTYGAIARRLSSSPRAVGNACRANPLPIIIPCHRVVSQVGLGGYGGDTQGERINIKNWLLQHEGVVIG